MTSAILPNPFDDLAKPAARKRRKPAKRKPARKRRASRR